MMISVATNPTHQSRSLRMIRLGALAFAASVASVSGASADDKPLGATTGGAGAVHLNILSLKHSDGDTVTLKWEVVNDGSSDYSMTPDNMRLVDLVGRRIYSVGLSSDGCGNTPAGKRIACWAIFAAPPPATKTVAIKFYENVEMVIGVPIAE